MSGEDFVSRRMRLARTQHPQGIRTIGQQRLDDPVNDQIRIAPDRRSEMRIARRGQSEMALVLLAVFRLLQRTQHEIGQDSLLRLSRDFRREPLVHLRRHRYLLRNLVVLRLVSPLVPCSSPLLLAPVGLHLHPLHRQRPNSKRVAERGRGVFEFDHPLRLRHLVDPIDRGRPQLLDPRRDAFVGGQHELLDQPVGPAAGRSHDVPHGAR